MRTRTREHFVSGRHLFSTAGVYTENPNFRAGQEGFGRNEARTWRNGAFLRMERVLVSSTFLACPSLFSRPRRTIPTYPSGIAARLNGCRAEKMPRD